MVIVYPLFGELSLQLRQYFLSTYYIDILEIKKISRHKHMLYYWVIKQKGFALY